MVNEQAQTAINIFTDYYGTPKWLDNPKVGQKPEEIMGVWSQELKGYTTGQIREACNWIVRRRRVMTFPSIDTLLCELSDREKQKDTLTPEEAIKSDLNFWLNTKFADNDDFIGKMMWEKHHYNYKGYVQKLKKQAEEAKMRDAESKLFFDFFKKYGIEKIYATAFSDPGKYKKVFSLWKEFKKTDEFKKALGETKDVTEN